MTNPTERITWLRQAMVNLRWVETVARLTCILLLLFSITGFKLLSANSKQIDSPEWKAKAIVSGGEFSCVLTEAGGVKCWGANQGRQLGDGTLTEQPTPVDVVGLTDGVTAIAAGGAFACALTQAGGVECWGAGDSNLMVSQETMSIQPVPITIAGLESGVTAIMAWRFTLCAWLADGSVRCLGNRSLVSPPIEAFLAEGIVEVELGDSHACALTQAGAVLCWGDNGLGQLGNGSYDSSETPITVAGLESGVKDIAVGDFFSCALTEAGAVKCWGANDYYQLGQESIESVLPIDVPGLESGVIAVTAGYAHACSVLESGGMKCWGLNDYGQVGSGESYSGQVDVVNLQNVVAAAAGAFHTCARLADGGVKCWGSNSSGQLGNGYQEAPAGATGVSGFSSALPTPTPISPTPTTTPIPTSRPQPQEPLKPAIAVSAGTDHTCAITEDGEAYCWGANQYGQLGDGSRRNHNTPVKVNGLPPASAISIGYTYTCALVEGGSVYCWGDNLYGQLGNPALRETLLPQPATGLGGKAVAIATGNNHTCALLESGQVQCWGSNYFGRLGDGSEVMESYSPTNVVGLTNVTAITAGQSFTCALRLDHSVWCWGDNYEGVLGDSGQRYSAVPVQVTGLPEVKAINAAGYHICALTTAEEVWCWGMNSSGQLGNNSTTNSPIPQIVQGLESEMSIIAAGDRHTCSASQDGQVLCWGNNSAGQLGDNTGLSQMLPVPVFDLPGGVIALTAGASYTCGLTDVGGVICWGSNSDGKLGDGSLTDRLAPVDVVNFGAAPPKPADIKPTPTLKPTPIPTAATVAQSIPAKALAAGTNHTCALTRDGAVWCWGGNDSGQLGDGTHNDRAIPSIVEGLSSGVSAITAGHSFTCALLLNGEVRCWGINNNGQLGDDTVEYRATPVAVVGLGGPVRAIGAGVGYACALTTSGGVKCWGAGYHGELGDGKAQISDTPVDVVGLQSGVVALAAGGAHTCALMETGGVKCWGWNVYGEIGDGSFSQRISPVDVIGLSSRVIAVDAKGGHTCALLESGEVRCWGDNLLGQAGGSARGYSSPTVVDGLEKNVRSISAGEQVTCALLDNGEARCWGSKPTFASTFPEGAVALVLGYDHFCALAADGRVRCWGGNGSGQLGNGTTSKSSEPVDVIGFGSPAGAAPQDSNTYLQIAAGGEFTCALTQDGKVKCWGRNQLGQLGNGNNEDSAYPGPVIGLLAPVKALSAGWAHTCALIETGSVACWGSNEAGQLGDGSFARNPGIAIPLEGEQNIIAVAAGTYHTCALTNEGLVWCWGSNSMSQLGNPSADFQATPILVNGLEGAIALATGAEHTCAVTQAGKVKCWGNNNDGQTGIENSAGVQTFPAEVPDLEQVAAITAGLYHTCAVTSTGYVKCWGNNSAGQLGDGTINSRAQPADVVGLREVTTSISANGYHTCVLSASNSLFCWGWNQFGQLGDGTHTDRLFPNPVKELENKVSAISAGFGHTCAIVYGAAYCWGSEGFGQLGTGISTYQNAPVAVVNLAQGVKQIVAGLFHTCALTQAGEIQCWGDNDAGQLGYQAYRDASSPVTVDDPETHQPFSDIQILGAGGQLTCVVTNSGSLQCWGDVAFDKPWDAASYLFSEPITLSELDQQVASLAIGWWHACALTNAGGVKCWGNNQNGQLGSGNTTSIQTPVEVIGLPGKALALSAGNEHSCALLEDRSVQCWGSNRSGQLGSPAGSFSSQPVAVQGLKGNAALLSAGGDHTCVFTDLGMVQCWGDYSWGGSTGNFTPQEIPELAGNVRALAAGGNFMCAISLGGGVKCWGGNQRGQLGNNSTQSSTQPVDVTGLSSGVISLAAGVNHACALLADGSMRCWGLNSSGQLGNGDCRCANHPVPVSQKEVQLLSTPSATPEEPILTPEIAPTTPLESWWRTIILTFLGVLFLVAIVLLILIARKK